MAASKLKENLKAAKANVRSLEKEHAAVCKAINKANLAADKIAGKLAKANDKVVGLKIRIAG